MITYLRMSSAWHRGDGPARVPRSLAGDGAVAAGGQGLLDVPGHAFGPAPPPADQHHGGGQARTVKTNHTESAFLRGWKRSPARQPGERGIDKELGSLAFRSRSATAAGLRSAVGWEPQGMVRAEGCLRRVPMPFGRLPGMDVRARANPVLAGARRWLARVNARHPWNHNEHFHGWILRNLPARRRVAVDVGCGTGMLAGKLAGHFARVTGIDADAGMAAAASARLDDDPGVTIRRCGFEEFGTAAGDGEADLIAMVAVLHHLDLDDTLARIPGLLAPGGRLLVVGLARVNSLPDLAVDLVSAAANPVMGLIKHPRPARLAEGPAAGQPAMPVRDPGTTLAEIIAAARAHLPGASVRRRLFFRYTLRWDKPPVTSPPPGSGTPARQPPSG